MREGRIVNEVFWIRSFACLAVAVIHAVYTTLENYEGVISQLDEYILITIRFAAFFGTPAFVFISELLLARVYPNALPEDFFWKRVQYLLLPFIFMGIVFAFVTNDNWSDIGMDALLNVFAGNYTGYFILVIFQFYLLHYLFHRFLRKSDPKIILPAALLINVGYLACFNFIAFPENTVGAYMWERGYWLLFVGWIFYFTLGYYCGLHYPLIKEKIAHFKWSIVLLPLVSFIIMVFLVRTDLLTTVSSKRLDNIFYTIGVISLIALATHRFEKVPRPVLFISKHSFHIYLLHKIFLYYLPTIPGMPPLLYFVLALVYAVGTSILVSHILSSFRWSTYLIGKKLPVPNLIKT
ncbi:acyltransferase family protein [Natribacillus halophilus]|uniref:Membrane-bound acyltransferase YfiQ, involved in biofilm formation n=1 Tax=Natribacillus halophilus TaxID=549003 RepID=A0A1G8NHI5_9BACI|nr:acyltransferase family protein [Natribacillus halophilus]SDI79653.1 Membrane-bound acyltransferase YfiQ, involved in biofilm formation [Natribacillus halophilus]